MSQYSNSHPFDITNSLLSQKVSKGSLWVVGGVLSAKVLGFVSVIILTRLLAPEDFGLMAVALAIISLSQLSTSTGFQSALIQRQGTLEDLLNTAWTLELCRYLVLSIIIFFSAPLLAGFLAEPKLKAILRLISVMFVCDGLRNIGVVYFRKNLELDKQFVFETAPLLASVAVAIPLAFVLRNVWALVWASIARALVSCAVSYIMHPYRPRPEVKVGKARELFGFGKWILGSALLAVVRKQGVTMFVGKYLSVPILGFYNRAQAFSITLFQHIVEVVWKVGYPAYSWLQSDAMKFKRAYLKTLQVSSFIGVPMAGGMLLLSGDFTRLLLTEKWLSIIPLIKVFCLQAALLFICTPASIMFQAAGRPSINTKISLAGIIVMAFLIFPLSAKFGVMGIALAVLSSALVPSPILFLMAARTTQSSFKEVLKPLLFASLSTAIMLLVVSLIRECVLVNISILGLLGLALSGVVAYFVVSKVLDKYLKCGTYALIRQRLSALRD